MSELETQQSQDQSTPDITPSELDHFFESGGELKQESSSESQEKNDEPVQEETETVDSNQQDQVENHSQEEPIKNSEAQRFKAMADEERIRRKESQKQIEQLRQENNQMKEVFNKLMTQQKQEEAPSFDEDPIKALKYENDQLKRDLQGIQQDTQRTRQEMDINNKQNQFINNYRNAANDFKSQNPDFDDAYNFLLESRMDEYEAAGYEKDQAEQLALEDEAAIAANHMKKGSNPAEAIYKLAQMRGYKSTKAGSVQEKIKDNEQKIQNLERGIRASKSVSSGGSNSKSSFSLEEVANMDDDEFSKVDWDRVLRMG